MRGEFRRADGLVIPNNITNLGIETLLKAALRDEAPTFHVALVNVVPEPVLLAQQLNEPTIGINGYSRITIPRSFIGWPNSGTAGDDYYLETIPLVWSATGGEFSGPIRRMALVSHPTQVVGDIVLAVSNSLPADLTISPTTPIEERTFAYRIYGR